MSTATTDRPALTADMSVEQTMALVATGKITVPEYLAWDKIRCERIASAAGAARSAAGIRLKVSEKGAVSIRGIRGINVRFGCTMYAVALEDIFANREKIVEFINANGSKLSRKAS